MLGSGCGHVVEVCDTAVVFCDIVVVLGRRPVLSSAVSMNVKET